MTNPEAAPASVPVSHGSESDSNVGLSAGFSEGDCIVMSPFQGPGAIWFRITRGWINGYGSEVPADWPTNHGAVLIAHAGKPVTNG